jgi:biopolymer transport protein TolQ
MRKDRRAEERDQASLTALLWNAPPLDIDFWALVENLGTVPLGVIVVLLGFSLLSFTIIFSKLGGFRRARKFNQHFLRAFRKSNRLDAVAAATEQYRGAPLVTVFEFGYSEVARQVASQARVTNLIALERTLQLGISEEIARLERNMNWLATTAAISPFIGLFGTVLGIMDAFLGLNRAGATNMQAVAPGIATALFTTALGLGAAIPAAIAYNYFGNAIREIGQRMEDFSLEFLNLTERNFEGL